MKFEVDLSADREYFWKNYTGHCKTNSSKNYRKLMHTSGAAMSVIKRRNFIGELAKINNIKSILELGCAEGSNLAHILFIYPEINKVSGIDINEEAIRYGKNIEEIPAALMTRSIYDLSIFKDKSFDVIFTCTTLLHVPDDKICSVISEMIRIAKNFVFHIECDGEYGIRNKRRAFFNKKVIVPHAFVHNFKSIYKRLGYTAHVKNMSDLINHVSTGGAEHMIWANLEKKLRFEKE